MTCREIRELISAYVDGEARPEDARLVEEHLGGCPQCRQAEKRMRELGLTVARTEGAVPPDFRERLFARMEAEELLPKRRSIFAYSVRWAAVPLAAAAALALYVLSSREAPRDVSPPSVRPPQVAGIEGDLSPEDREIVAYLEVLEDPEPFEEMEIEEMEIFAPPPRQQG